MGVVLIRLIVSCQNDGLIAIENTSPFLSKLSQYGIFQGKPSNLTPSVGFHLYELSATLFTDYAEKQRLIKLPPGTTLTSQGKGLPGFPNGTMIVKTFYYDKDQRDTSKGKVIIETRLLIKTELGWNVATYLWNDDQQDATLVTSGFNKTVNWIDASGNAQIISYHVPSNRECTTCHQLSGEVLPIGPKLRNLNRPVNRNNQTINQLDFLQQAGVLSSITPATVPSLPDYSNSALPLSERARAYAEINCTHCHNAAGYAASTKLFFGYDLPYDQTTIASHKDKIIQLMESGTMPRLGTTVVDQPGLALLKSYIKSLP
ncbi:SO2930 family diheme c-type cytochrome [Spirosoma gilvum]